MRGCFYEEFGPCERVLKMGAQLPVPQLEGATDVKVRVHAASINPADYKQTLGGETRFLMVRPFPIKPGFDFAGVVEEVGSEVTRVKVGDEVFGMVRGLRTGTTAEYIVTEEHVLSRKPDGISMNEAAGVPLAAITAFQCLVKCGLPFPPTEASVRKSVLCTGGPGGVGTFVIQLAKKLFGVGRVVTTASSQAKQDLCTSLGADRVVDYRKDRFWNVLANERFDACVDCTGESANMLGLVNPEGGGIATIFGASQEMLQEWVDNLGPRPGIRVRVPVLAAVKSPFLPLDLFTGTWWTRKKLPGTATFHCIITIPTHEVLDHIAPLLASGAIRVVVDQVFPLDRAVDAYVKSSQGTAVGKIIVQVV